LWFDRGDDGVNREHQINDHNLGNGGTRAPDGDRLVVRRSFEFVMDFVCGFSNEEEAAADENDIAPGNPNSEKKEERLREPHKPGESGEHDDAKEECERQAYPAGVTRFPLLEPGSEQRDKDQIVNAEHDLEHAQAQERRPRMRIGQQCGGVHFVHA
jgi:hypothetical protein